MFQGVCSVRTYVRWYPGALAAALFTFAGAATGAKAPDFTLPDPQGKRVHLQALLERGPVLVDFWATWCKPCVKAMPKLVDIHKAYSKRGLTVLGVNEDGPRGHAKVAPFLRARGIPFPVVLDGNGSVMRRMQARALPTTVLIAQDGEIVFRQVGFAHEKALIQAIEALLPAPKETAGESDSGR